MGSIVWLGAWYPIRNCGSLVSHQELSELGIPSGTVGAWYPIRGNVDTHDTMALIIINNNMIWCGSSEGATNFRVVRRVPSREGGFCRSRDEELLPTGISAGRRTSLDLSGTPYLLSSSQYKQVYLYCNTWQQAQIVVVTKCQGLKNSKKCRRKPT